MSKYRILVSAKVQKDLEDINKPDLKRVLNVIEELGNNPRPVGCKKLVGSPFWRVRSGQYRIVYSISDNILTIEVVRVAHRKDVYR
jgi:mRNA interferase RelE/StbE